MVGQNKEKEGNVVLITVLRCTIFASPTRHRIWKQSCSTSKPRPLEVASYIVGPPTGITTTSSWRCVLPMQKRHTLDVDPWSSSFHSIPP